MALITIAVIFTMMGIYAETPDCPVDAPKKLMVHYMPWYVSRSFSGKWGWHWTMDRYNPDEVKQDGKCEIASHYYPLIGPYDSGDPDALECQVLLMKFAGIDGIIIDWYGIEDFYDYAIINRNTQRIINYAKKAGLEFAICYEDQTIKRMIEAGYMRHEEAVDHGQSVMQWLQNHCFDSKTYLKVDARPALFVFGPQYFNSSQWEQVFSVLPKRPFFYTLNHRQGGADGAFGWPPMNGAVTAPDQWRGYLEDFYVKNSDADSCVGTVFPQFHDIYAEAGVGKSHGFLDAREGRTFTDTLDLALRSNCRVIQIVTWNDYGEGTMIEPTEEFGYGYLEIIQHYGRQRSGPSFPYITADLRLPVELYQLKKKHQSNQSVMKELSNCSNHLFSGDLIAAKSLMKPLEEL